MMGGLTVAELTATLGLDDAGFSRGLGGMDAKFGSFSKRGVAAAAGVAVGFATLAAAALKFAGEFDNAYDSIRIGTGATGKALDSLKGSFKNVVKTVPTDFASASSAITELNRRLGLTGPQLEKRSEQFLELSRITGTDVSTNVRDATRLFGDWSVATGAQAGVLDQLFRATQQSGIGLNELMTVVVDNGATLRQLGFDLDSSITMFSKFEKEGVNASKVVQGFGQLNKYATKEGRDGIDVWNETVKAIKNGTEAEAKSIGQKVFGVRAANDMVAAIREQRFSYEDLKASIKGGGDTILKAAEDTNDWAESLTLLKNKALVALEPSLMRIFDGLTKAVDAFAGLDSGTQTALITLAGIVTIGGGATVMLGKLATSVLALKAAFIGASSAGSGLVSTLPNIAKATVGRGPGMLVTPAAGGAAGAAGAGGSAVGAGLLAAGGVAALAAAAAGIAVVAIRNHQVQQEYDKIAEQTGVRIDKGARTWTSGGKGAPVSTNSPMITAENRQQAAVAMSNRPLLQKLEIRAQDATGPAFAKVMARYEEARVLTAKGIGLRSTPRSRWLACSPSRRGSWRRGRAASRRSPPWSASSVRTWSHRSANGCSASRRSWRPLSRASSTSTSRWPPGSSRRSPWGRSMRATHWRPSVTSTPPCSG